MDLSIIIPVYNERNKIADDIRSASDFFTDYNIKGEIIVVDDGSNDQSSEIAGNTEVLPGITLRIIHYQPHRGKGFAVKKGMLESSGDYVLFIDSGGCVPFANIIRGIELICEGTCDIAHGSRELPDSRILRFKKWHRRIGALLFRKFVQFYIKIPQHLTDTQCGLKIYKKNIAHELYSESITEGFMFDIEIILLAEQRGYRIKEFPIEWTADPDSRLSVIKTFFSVFYELSRIKKGHKGPQRYNENHRE